jgi:hypothetical protein
MQGRAHIPTSHFLKLSLHDYCRIELNNYLLVPQAEQQVEQLG